MTDKDSTPELSGPLAGQFAELARGTQEVLTAADLVRKLRREKPLIVKAGFDPTAPDLHLGHTVLLNKMRQFQQFGQRPALHGQRRDLKRQCQPVARYVY